MQLVRGRCNPVHPVNSTGSTGSERHPRHLRRIFRTMHQPGKKCSVTNIYGGEAALPQIISILGCQEQHFPIRYLGLPISARTIPKANQQALVEAVARKLPSSHASLMNRSGRLIWVKSVLRSVPIYAMMAENLPPWVAKEIDSICRKFFWSGTDQSVRGRCMVAWKTCCRPTHLGGLGISDLRLTGNAL